MNLSYFALNGRAYVVTVSSTNIVVTLWTDVTLYHDVTSQKMKVLLHLALVK